MAVPKYWTNVGTRLNTKHHTPTTFDKKWTNKKNNNKPTTKPRPSIFIKAGTQNDLYKVQGYYLNVYYTVRIRNIDRYIEYVILKQKQIIFTTRVNLNKFDDDCINLNKW